MRRADVYSCEGVIGLIGCILGEIVLPRLSTSAQGIRRNAKERICFMTGASRLLFASAAHAVAKVDNATLSFENPDPLQFALLDAEVLKQTPPVTQQDWD
jgi:hypothetical protein